MLFNSQFLLDKEKGKLDAKVRFRVKWKKESEWKIVAFSLGYRVEIEKWSTDTQRCKINTTHGKKKISSSLINKKIEKYGRIADELFDKYRTRQIPPEEDEFKNDFNFKLGNSKTNRIKDNQTLSQIFDEYIKQESQLNNWSYSTNSFKLLTK